jgi:hypothetical protein
VPETSDIAGESRVDESLTTDEDMERADWLEPKPEEEAEDPDMYSVRHFSL